MSQYIHVTVTLIWGTNVSSTSLLCLSVFALLYKTLTHVLRPVCYSKHNDSSELNEIKLKSVRRANLSLTFSIFLLTKDLGSGCNTLFIGIASVSVCIIYIGYILMNAAQSNCFGAGDQEKK